MNQAWELFATDAASMLIFSACMAVMVAAAFLAWPNKTFRAAAITLWAGHFAQTFFQFTWPGANLLTPLPWAIVYFVMFLYLATLFRRTKDRHVFHIAWPMAVFALICVGFAGSQSGLPRNGTANYILTMGLPILGVYPSMALLLGSLKARSRAAQSVTENT